MSTFERWCKSERGRFGDGTIEIGVDQLCFFEDATVKLMEGGRVETQPTSKKQLKTRHSSSYDNMHISGGALILEKNGERVGKLLGGPQRRPLGAPKKRLGE